MFGCGYNQISDKLLVLTNSSSLTSPLRQDRAASNTAPIMGYVRLCGLCNLLSYGSFPAIDCLADMLLLTSNASARNVDGGLCGLCCCQCSALPFSYHTACSPWRDHYPIFVLRTFHSSYSLQLFAALCVEERAQMLASLALPLV
jgi:hypothetical protein